MDGIKFSPIFYGSRKTAGKGKRRRNEKTYRPINRNLVKNHFLYDKMCICERGGSKMGKERQMKAYAWENGKLKEYSSLMDALKIPVSSGMVISLVGAGGKTSTMYRLADEMMVRGKSVIVTTSTHILKPAKGLVILAERAWEVKERLKKESWPRCVVVGREGEQGKLKGLEPEELAKLKELADCVLIEADGSKGLPLKIPGSWEPVVIPQTDLVIGCVGLDCVGKPAGEVCFRLALAGDSFRGFGKPDKPVEPEDAAEILTSLMGTRKAVEDREYRIVLNKADDEENLNNGMRILREIDKRGQVICAVTSYEEYAGKGR